MTYAKTITLDLAYEEAVPEVKETSLDPKVIAEVPGITELESVAEEAGRHIDAALAELAS